MIEQNQIIVPFLKWAGGKRWLVSSGHHVFPNKYNRYVEPFLGSAAVFFHLKPAKAILSDRNQELIETYIAIKNEWESVVKILRQHQRLHSKEYYYHVRTQKTRTTYRRAAQFIYLNRTCWNGLFRVNLSGEFNVPIGTKTKVLLESDDFQNVSNLLKNASLRCADFETIVDETREDDFLFVDPPYTVKHNINGFIKYNENLFSWQDQIRLRNCLVNARERGVKILMTNADHNSVRSLYKDWKIVKAKRSSLIASSSSSRGRVAELLITS